MTREDWAEWIKQSFEDCDSLNFEAKREKYDYYEQLYELNIEEEENL